MRKLLMFLFAVMIVIFSGIVSSEPWTTSGQFDNGNIIFYYDDSGIWNQTGSILTPNTGTTINITGSYYGDGSHLTGISIPAGAVTDVWVNSSGDTMTGNLNMSGNRLTDIGKIIMQGLANVQNVIPITHNLYTLGNSSHWFAEAYITDVYAKTLNTSTINSTAIDSISIDSISVDSETMNSITMNASNMTLSIIKPDDGNVVIIL